MDTEFQNYPFLTGDEFVELCHHLDRQYCQASLGPLRKQWKLRVCSAFNTSFSLGPEYSTHVQIIRPLEGELDDGNLSAFLENFSFDDGPTGLEPDIEMMAAEDADEAVLPPRPKPRYGHVTYEIHLHPTYRAPCLWFSLHDLPADEPAFSIDTVFRRLVPDQFKAALRNAGPIGGISADHHPITGVPAFFVHPCLLGEAMARFGCSKETYLMLWLGLVGGCVGLWVPKEMAMAS